MLKKAENIRVFKIFGDDFVLLSREELRYDINHIDLTKESIGTLTDIEQLLRKQA